LKNLNGRHHLEDLNRYEKMVLKQILEKSDGIMLTGFIWLKRKASGLALVNTAMNLWVP
jgi:hypothetical protein